MAYTRNPTWQPGVAGGTKVTAVGLNAIEDGLVAASAAADTAQTTALEAEASANAASVSAANSATDAQTARAAAESAASTASTALASRVPIPAGITDGQVPTWNATTQTWQGGNGSGISVGATQPSGPALWLIIPAGPDTTPPVAGTLSVTPGRTFADLSVSGASDAVALDASPYAYSSNGGASWSAWQSTSTYTITGLTESTAYTFRHKVRDAAGNETLGTSVGASTTSPVTLAADDFTRANTAVGGLGTTPTGSKAWVDPTPAYRVLTNQCDPADSGATQNVAYVDTGQQNVTVSAKIFITSTPSSGLVARVSAADTLYLGRTSAGNLQLYRFMADAGTQVGSNVAYTWVTGDKLTLQVSEEATGTRLRLLVNDVEKLNVLDTTASRPTGTGAGFRSNGAGTALYDDFTVTT